jgi:hypothetical protein
VNLLLAPFLAFALLLLLFLKHHNKAPPLAAAHLEQTVRASLWIAVMFIAAAGCVMTMRYAGIEDIALWVLVVILFTIIHASMVLLGAFGLAKALSGHCWRYPMFGSELPQDCPQ